MRPLPQHDRREGRAIEMRDLAAVGFPEMPLFGIYHNLRALRGLDPHRHDAIEICFLDTGQQTYRVGGRAYVLHPGDLYVTLPDEEHDSGGQPQERGLLRWLHVRPPPPGRGFLGLTPAQSRPLADGLLRLGARRCFPGTPRVRQAFLTAEQRLAAAAAPLGRQALGNALIEVMLAVLEAAALPPPTGRPASLNPALHLIEDNLNRQLRVPELARAAGLSTSAFKARFRREIGLPPADYVNRRRIALAQHQLRDSRRSVTAIALALGFTSSQYFATQFRRYTGQSPARFRAGARAGS